MLEWVHDNVIWVVVALFLAAAAIPYLLKLMPVPVLTPSRAQNMAKDLASHRWYLIHAAINEPRMRKVLKPNGWEVQGERDDVIRRVHEDAGHSKDYAHLRLSSQDSARFTNIVSFDITHPDFPKVQELGYMSLVGFQFLESPIEGQLPTEEASYLRLQHGSEDIRA